MFLDILANGKKHHLVIAFALLTCLSGVGYVFAEQEKVKDKLDEKVDNATLRLLIEQTNALVTLQIAQQDGINKRLSSLESDQVSRYLELKSDAFTVQRQQAEALKGVTDTNNDIALQMREIQSELRAIKARLE